MNVTMKAPEGANSISIGGSAYEVASDGMISLPAELADIARSHGYTDIQQSAQAPDAPTPQTGNTQGGPPPKLTADQISGMGINELRAALKERNVAMAVGMNTEALRELLTAENEKA